MSALKERSLHVIVVVDLARVRLHPNSALFDRAVFSLLEYFYPALSLVELLAAIACKPGAALEFGNRFLETEASVLQALGDLFQLFKRFLEARLSLCR